MDEELDLLELFYAFWKRKLWLIIAVLVGAVLGLFYTSFLVTPKYTSSVTLILSKPSNITSTETIINEGAITQSDIQLNQKLISTYSEIMKSRRISNTVIENLNLDMSYEEIIECVNVSSVKDTDVIKLSITTIDPNLAARIATEMTKVFTEEIVDIYNIQNISIIDEAEVDEEPVNISYVKNVIIFMMVAFVLMAGVIFVIYYFDNSIKGEEDVQKLTGLPVLCLIPTFDEEKRGGKNNG